MIRQTVIHHTPRQRFTQRCCAIHRHGKTCVALAVASAASAAETRVLIIAPATLGPTWHAACAQAHVHADIISIEALSYRAHIPTHLYELVIVDEAHQLRTPSTKRYTALAQLCAQARVLLLSATPIHNRYNNLTTLLALFLGARTDTLSESELARILIRRTQTARNRQRHAMRVHCSSPRTS